MSAIFRDIIVSVKNGTSRKGAKEHSNHIVARALVMLMLGHSVQEVSDTLKIPQPSVSRWRALLPPEVNRGESKKEIIEDLYGQYLESGLKTLLAQIEVASDPD